MRGRGTHKPKEYKVYYDGAQFLYVEKPENDSPEEEQRVVKAGIPFKEGTFDKDLAFFHWRAYTFRDLPEDMLVTFATRPALITQTSKTYAILVPKNK